MLDIQGETEESRRRIGSRVLLGLNGELGNGKDVLRCQDGRDCTGKDFVVVTILKLDEKKAIVEVAGASVLPFIRRLLQASDCIEVVKTEGKWRFGRVLTSEIH